MLKNRVVKHSVVEMLIDAYVEAENKAGQSQRPREQSKMTGSAADYRPERQGVSATVKHRIT